MNKYGFNNCCFTVALCWMGGFMMGWGSKLEAIDKNRVCIGFQISDIQNAFDHFITHTLKSI